ncbi:hypothetical protein NIG5292_02782 [Nereida ignava]|uniref:Uncharacterized protein n=1 Tax=Nereida ignava TaxID=282199 RepID=A0A0U1NPS4_9RHOB|nr:hypothetical protein [Nereida ignava]CRK76717.1 hypothetical protein NIG5292_02782 [Nereida ignava]SFJ89222.1 hypothetical protein SAMN02745667_02694 [Nereida ignava DSM 16309]
MTEASEEAVRIVLGQQVGDFLVRQRATGQVSQRKFFAGFVENFLKRRRLVAQATLECAPADTQLCA